MTSAEATKMKSDSTTINIPPQTTKTDSKAKVGAKSVPVVAGSSSKNAKGGRKRRIGAIFDLILRIAAIATALAAATVMGTSDQILPIFTQVFQFKASFDDFPAFLYFVVAMAVVSGYLVLSLPLSILRIIRPRLAAARLLLLIFDTLMIALTSSAGAAAAAIVYLAHNGSSTANWIAMCQQFDQFCQDTSGAAVASFITAVILILLVIMSAIGLKKK